MAEDSRDNFINALSQYKQAAGVPETPVAPVDEPSEPKSGIRYNELKYLAENKLINPQNVDMLADEVAAGNLREEEAKEIARSALNLKMTPEERAPIQEFADQYTQAALQGTDLEQPQQPVDLTRPQQDLDLVVEQEQEAVRAEQAKQAARQKVEAEKQVAAIKQEEKAQERIAQQDEQAARELEEDTGPSKFVKALAILVAGVGQGYTGDKGPNPALAYLERELERRAQAKKLSAEQKLAQQKLAIDQAQLALQQEETKTNSAYKRAQIQKINAELGEASIALLQKQELMARMQTRGGLTAQEAALLPADQQEKLVQTTNGMYVPVFRSQDAKKLTEDLPLNKAAQDDIASLKELVDKFGNNPLAKLVNRTDRARAEALQRSIIGNLRLELFGPGVMTDAEQRLAQQIVRSGTDVFSLASANRASLDTLLQKLKYSERLKLRAAGANVPLSYNEKLLQAAKQKFPKEKDADLISALIKQGKWQDE